MQLKIMNERVPLRITDHALIGSEDIYSAGKDATGKEGINMKTPLIKVAMWI